MARILCDLDPVHGGGFAANRNLALALFSKPPRYLYVVAPSSSSGLHAVFNVSTRALASVGCGHVVSMHFCFLAWLFGVPTARHHARASEGGASRVAKRWPGNHAGYGV